MRLFALQKLELPVFAKRIAWPSWAKKSSLFFTFLYLQTTSSFLLRVSKNVCDCILHHQVLHHRKTEVYHLVQLQPSRSYELRISYPSTVSYCFRLHIIFDLFYLWIDCQIIWKLSVGSKIASKLAKCNFRAPILGLSESLSCNVAFHYSNWARMTWTMVAIKKMQTSLKKLWKGTWRLCQVAMLWGKFFYGLCRAM